MLIINIECYCVMLVEKDSFSPKQFGGKFFQPITWHLKKLSTCIFSHMSLVFLVT